MKKEDLYTDSFLDKLAVVYVTSKEGAKPYADRLCSLFDGFSTEFGTKEDLHLFSAPGRTEICGNHTDHQRGQVLAAAVNLDIVAAVALNGTDKIRIKSEGYETSVIDLSDLAIKPEEYNTTNALIRGITSYFVDSGICVTGFDAYMVSNVLKGSGLSSSAAFEVLIGTILNSLFQGGVDAIKIAQIGQYAENEYFGKPSGLMDQMASSVGSFVHIDFFDKENPIVKKVDFDFAGCGYQLCIIDTGGNHADLTPDYAAVPTEMKSIASYFGKEVLSELNKEVILGRIPELRQACGDRAVLRAIHFFDDSARVSKQTAALSSGDFETFKALIRQSGHSSFMHLQNVFCCSNVQEQGLSLALAACEYLLDKNGAYRVHGGGFAGTVQAFVPTSDLEAFRAKIESIFGAGKCYVLSIRPFGGIELSN